MQNGDAGVQRRREDPEAGMEAGVAVAPSAAHGRFGVRRRRDDPEAGMEACVAIAPSSAPVSPRTAAAFEKIDAMYKEARLYDTMFANNDDVVPFWEDDIEEQEEVNPLIENWIE